MTAWSRNYFMYYIQTHKMEICYRTCLTHTNDAYVSNNRMVSDTTLI